MDENPRDLARLDDMTRMRGVRVSLALSEVSRLRMEQARAQAALDEACHRRAEHERQAAAVEVLPQTPGNGEVHFSAEHAHHLMSYVAALHLKAQEDAESIRRAELARARVQDATDEARDKYRRAVSRHETLLSLWKKNLRAARNRKLECEEESLAEEWLYATLVSRSVADTGSLDHERSRND